MVRYIKVDIIHDLDFLRTQRSGKWLFRHQIRRVSIRLGQRSKLAGPQGPNRVGTFPSHRPVPRTSHTLLVDERNRFNFRIDFFKDKLEDGYR